MKDMPLINTPEQVDEMIQSFSKELHHFEKEEQDRIMEACLWARELHFHQKRASGEFYIIHPLSVARTLLELQLDATAVIAGLLHDILEDTAVKRKELEERFGSDVARIVAGVTKINIVNVKNKSVQERETIRKMLLAMNRDIRVILIKLADKRHNMNTLQYMRPDKQKRIARECLDIYAPLAGKLGIYSIKTELEDLCLKFLKPHVYKEIEEFLNREMGERHDFLKKIEETILTATREEGIAVTLKARSKHMFSIYRKMKTKGRELSEIYDFLGIRILCRTSTQCYTLLGLVHHIYKPLDGRFKDYIAMPKENGYKSLHTSVMTPAGRPLEVQIRTYKMNETAEYGVAAHWAYKEGRKAGVHKQPPLLKKLKDMSEKVKSSEFMDSLKQDILTDTIVVFTPQGDTIELPKGSTAIDFAYHIHSHIGEHCLSAKANDAIIPLNRPLKSTQTVCIQTSPEAHPHLNWLRFLKTNRARSKVRAWLNKHDSDVLIDRNVVARKKSRLNPVCLPEKKGEKGKDLSLGEGTGNTGKMMDHQKVGVSINRERNLMIHLAGCCKPAPGDRIIGFISRGRGIIVHKSDCSNLQGIHDFEERKIHVEWENWSNKAIESFRVNARNVPDLFSELEGAIRKQGGHLVSGSITETDRGDLEGFFSVEMNRIEDYKKIAKNIRAIPAVMNIQKEKRY